MNSRQDIYWSYVSINALKHSDIGVFHYSLRHITDNARKIKLMTIYEGLKCNDVEIMEALNRYSCPFPIHVA